MQVARARRLAASIGASLVVLGCATFGWPAKEPAVDTKDPRELEGFLRRKCGWQLTLK